MTTIQQHIADLEATLDLLKAVIPPDDESHLYISVGGRVISISWVQPPETYAHHHPDADTKAMAREAARVHALGFLGIWDNRLRKLTHHDRVKTYGEYNVSVEATLDTGWTVKAMAESESVCELVPVLDDGGNPVMEDKEERIYPEPIVITRPQPKMDKVCPPSFLAGIEGEL